LATSLRPVAKTPVVPGPMLTCRWCPWSHWQRVVSIVQVPGLYPGLLRPLTHEHV
jgi:hypothetical protein